MIVLCLIQLSSAMFSLRTRSVKKPAAWLPSKLEADFGGARIQQQNHLGLGIYTYELGYFVTWKAGAGLFKIWCLSPILLIWSSENLNTHCSKCTEISLFKVCQSWCNKIFYLVEARLLGVAQNKQPKEWTTNACQLYACRPWPAICLSPQHYFSVTY